MNGLVPKGQLTAYQRWEMAAFDEAEQAAKRAAKEAAQNVTPPAVDDSEAVDQTPLVLPTAEDIERMHIEAHEQGYAEGLAAGTAAGHAEGYKAGHSEGSAAALANAKKIGALMGSLSQSLQDIDQKLAEQLLATAVEIAKQMVHHSLRIKPELLLPVVREAVAAINAHAGHPALFAHPEDAALIRTHLGEQLAHNNWRIIDDDALSRGGCRVELSASEVDATLETRWRRVIEAIGVDTGWLNETLSTAKSNE